MKGMEWNRMEFVGTLDLSSCDDDANAFDVSRACAPDGYGTFGERRGEQREAEEEDDDRAKRDRSRSSRAVIVVCPLARSFDLISLSRATISSLSLSFVRSRFSRSLVRSISSLSLARSLALLSRHELTLTSHPLSDGLYIWRVCCFPHACPLVDGKVSVGSRCKNVRRRCCSALSVHPAARRARVGARLVEVSNDVAHKDWSH